ncbi:MAG: LPXTG cell wall anchor domain-containing protein [Clostridiales bacterium]|nr:LPXTG cell wall anchor domain-containing protein [Clostridiales bacterium]
MGTKIFYTLGGLLAVGAGILLIVKRRMRNV